MFITGENEHVSGLQGEIHWLVAFKNRSVMYLNKRVGSTKVATWALKLRNLYCFTVFQAKGLFIACPKLVLLCFLVQQGYPYHICLVAMLVTLAKFGYL